MGATKTVLIVEDEADLADAIAFNLQREGYVCRRAGDGETALAEVQRQPLDLIILDRMLPLRSGDEVLSKLRKDGRTSGIPVILLTAKAEETDELVGFALGADDYISKPFSIKLLLARVAALLRRREQPASSAEILSDGPITLDAGRHEVSVGGQSLTVTATEFRLLRALMSARGRVLSREQLIDSALGQDVAVTDRTIDVHVAALRKKLGVAADHIQTIRGAGYAFRTPG